MGTLLEPATFLTEMPVSWEAPAELPELSWVPKSSIPDSEKHIDWGKITVGPVRFVSHFRGLLQPPHAGDEKVEIQRG